MNTRSTYQSNNHANAVTRYRYVMVMMCVLLFGLANATAGELERRQAKRGQRPRREPADQTSIVQRYADNNEARTATGLNDSQLSQALNLLKGLSVTRGD